MDHAEEMVHLGLLAEQSKEIQDHQGQKGHKEKQARLEQKAQKVRKE